MSDTLKPCPFCGETPDINAPSTFQETNTSKWGAVVCCCTGPEVRTGYGPVEQWRDEAIKAWNTRPSDTAAEACGIAAGLERAAQWHDGENAYAHAKADLSRQSPLVYRAWKEDAECHSRSARMLRAISHDPSKGGEGRGS